MYLPAAILIFIIVHSSSSHIRYVRPNYSSPLSCPGQLCLTLDQYTQQTPQYFTTGSIFVVLSGNHSLSSTVSLTNISNITIRGELSDSLVIVSGEIRCQRVANLTIEGLKFLFSHDVVNKEESVLVFIRSVGILINQTIFESIKRDNQSLLRAVHVTRSILTAVDCLFKGNTGRSGGAIFISARSKITLINTIFISNKANKDGGAISSDDHSLLYINGSIFIQNRAGNDGGAVSAVSASKVRINSVIGDEFPRTIDYISRYYNLTFEENLADNYLNSPRAVLFSDNSADMYGGSINVHCSDLVIGRATIVVFRNSTAHYGGALRSYGTFFFGNCVSYLTLDAQYLYFIENRAKTNGGAIHIQNGILTLGLSSNIDNMIRFENNSAQSGGGIYNIDSSVQNNVKVIFFGNIAQQTGGGLYAGEGLVSKRLVLSHTTFIGNKAMECGGAVYIAYSKDINFKNMHAVENSESALCIIRSRVKFSGTTNFSRNSGKEGGAIAILSRGTDLSFTGVAVFEGNRADSGGAIFSFYTTTLTFDCSTQFSNNRATSHGGAICALDTNIVVTDGNGINFNYNTAQDGGAMYLNSVSTLTLDIWTTFNTSHNHASKYGGVIYHEDSAIPLQCKFDNENDTQEVDKLPFCFIGFTIFFRKTEFATYNDSSGIDGSYIYGGLLDRCQMKRSVHGLHMAQTLVPYQILLESISGDVHKSMITSKPYKLCFCDQQSSNCSEATTMSIEVYRGQMFSVSLLAKDQLKNSISTQCLVSAKVYKTSRLKLNQSSQILQPNCSSLSYALYSTDSSEELVLYPDGPCRDSGVAKAVINVTLLPCPDGFDISGEKCVCAKRLQEYGADCVIDKEAYILRKNGSRFWISGAYSNNSYLGLILYDTCPALYCTERTVRVVLDDPDIQCANTRSGVLCGGCAANHSLMLGSSQCEECPNNYLSLLILFATAGIVLAVFLSVLRLTVATGMINSVILYANIVQVNRDIFFLGYSRNILTVYIAWLNLDLGFETCFFNGMTAYAQTWLQFAFPIYLWILVSLIILVSRYSISISKVIGHNPVAVLATLLLMSYTKMLRIIIEVYSSVVLEYPESKSRVWLKDANIPYLQSWHLLLTVVTSLVLVFIFLPYTLLLLFGHKLYIFSGRKHFNWIRKLKPLLDSYYAPYKTHTCYWTGFLLLVRCVLYIVFSFNPLGGANKSLLAIIIAFTAIELSSGYLVSGKIYTKLYTSIIETSIYLNLIVLSAVTLANLNSAALVYSLVGIVFVTMISIIVYHFHITYTTRSAWWFKVETKICTSARKLYESILKSPAPLSPVDIPATSSSHDPHKIVTKSVIELREPLLEK